MSGSVTVTMDMERFGRWLAVPAVTVPSGPVVQCTHQVGHASWRVEHEFDMVGRCDGTT